MSIEDAHKNPIQQFEHAMATILSCRGLIKYHIQLESDQKNELLNDIDMTLRFLRARLVANAAIESNLSLPQLRQAGLLSSASLPDLQQAMQEFKGEAKHAREGATAQPDLQTLHRLYRAYISTQQSNTQTFTARFNDAIATMNEVQALIETSRDLYSHHVYISNRLQQVGGFLADLYCLFMEFMNALSSALAGKEIWIDTEEISSLYRHAPESSPLPNTNKLQFDGQDLQQRLNDRSETIMKQLTEAAAFLIFLEDGLKNSLNRRPEIFEQLNRVALLFNEIARLLVDYHRTLGELLSPE